MSYGGGGGGFREREMFEATCYECNKPCQLPFKPTGERPVYCNDCFQYRRPPRRDPPPRYDYDRRPRYESRDRDRDRDYRDRDHRDRPRIDRGNREITTVVCDECRVECEIPFRPLDDRPVYCNDCFRRRRSGGRGGYDRDRDRDRGDRYGDRGGYERRRERQMFDAVCAECKKDTQIPFRPTEDRPVYCRPCFDERREKGLDMYDGGRKEEKKDDDEEKVTGEKRKRDDDEEEKETKEDEYKEAEDEDEPERKRQKVDDDDEDE